jgi:hypothetical protein
MTCWSLYRKIKQTPLNGLVHQRLIIVMIVTSSKATPSYKQTYWPMNFLPTDLAPDRMPGSGAFLLPNLSRRRSIRSEKFGCTLGLV